MEIVAITRTRFGATVVILIAASIAGVLPGSSTDKIPDFCRCLSTVSNDLSATCRWCSDVIRRDTDGPDDLAGSSYYPEGWPCRDKGLQNVSAVTCQDGGLETFPVLDAQRPLVFVDLRRNAIRRLDDVTSAKAWQRRGAVVNVTHLRLSENRLTSIHAPAASSSGRNWRQFLVTLDLSHNELAALDQETFRGFSRLVRLDLSHNRLARLSGSPFVRLTALTTLDLGGNRLTRLGDRTFRGLGQLGYLLLDANLITEIEPDTFVVLERLVYIVLRDNPLEFLDRQLKVFIVIVVSS